MAKAGGNMPHVSVEKAPAPAPTGQSLAERIPSMTDAQLDALQVNAERFSKMTNDRKQAEAAELLPLIAAELAVRKTQKSAAAAERSKASADKRATARARKQREKALEAEAAGSAADESED